MAMEPTELHTLLEALAMGKVDVHADAFVLVAPTIQGSAHSGVCIVGGAHDSIVSMILNLLERLPPEIKTELEGLMVDAIVDQAVMASERGEETQH